MNYFFVKKDTSEIFGVTDEMNDDLKALMEADDPNLLIVESEVYVEARHYDMYQYANGAISMIDGMDVNDPVVSRAEINAFRDRLALEPITFDGMTFDTDDRSIQKMSDIGDVIRDNDNITWTMGDNTERAFTGYSFKSALVRLKQYRSTKIYNYHAHAKALKEKLPNVFVSDLKEEKWGDGLRGIIGVFGE